MPAEVVARAIDATIPSEIVTEPAKSDSEHTALLGSVIAQRYRLDEILGVGGMGTVYRAHHLLLKQDVAVKVLHPDLAANPEIAERFDREGQSAARLDHPNIIDIKDVGTTDTGMKYMVMPVLKGEELVARLGMPLAPRRALEMIDQIFAGLEHAHERGVIHRDLKPENVFVTQDHEHHEVLKLVDFGIAKMLKSARDEGSSDDASEDDERLQPLTRLGLVFGTPQYMSPEQATGTDIDARTDLYSAGIILFEMLSGRPPFENDDPVALVRMQVTVDPAPLDKLVPAPVARLVARLLAKARDDRFADAAEVRLAIASAIVQLDGEDDTPPDGDAAASMRQPLSPTITAVEIEPSPGDAATTTPPRPSRRNLAVVLAAAGALTGAIAWAAWPSAPQSVTPETGTVAIAIAGAVEDVILAGTKDEHDAIRKALLAKNGNEALALIKPLRDEHPESPQLLWFEGRAFALERGKKSLALARYADALERDASLIDDQDFYAELYELLNLRKLRDEAVNLAVQRLGSQGHKFLLQRVNEEDPKQTLGYVDRHRVLAELASDPEKFELVNHQLNLARDLRQAKLTAEPCIIYARALTAIQEHPNAYYLLPLRKTRVPRPTDDGEDALLCPALYGQLAALLLQHQAAYGELTSQGAADPEGAKDPIETNAQGPTSNAPAPKPSKKKTNTKAASKKKRKNNLFKKLGDALRG